MVRLNQNQEEAEEIEELVFLSPLVCAKEEEEMWNQILLMIRKDWIH